MTVLVKSEDVANAVVARLATISIANGFETDIGLKIQRGRRKFPADSDPPVIQFIEGDDAVEDTAGRTRTALVKVEQTYVIDAFDVCDPDNPNTQAHKMIRDMKRAVFAADRTLGGIVSDVKYLGKDIGPRLDGIALVQARIVIAVCFAEDLSKP